MELILTKDVSNIGKKGDVVRVRNGYGRNFLLPQKLAIAATRSNREFVDDQRARSVARNAKEKMKAQEEAKELQELELVVPARAGDQDKLFGSITSEDICQALSEKGYSFTKKQIKLKVPIRSLGVYSVSIEVFPEVKSSVSLKVVAKTE